MSPEFGGKLRAECDTKLPLPTLLLARYSVNLMKKYLKKNEKYSEFDSTLVIVKYVTFLEHIGRSTLYLRLLSIKVIFKIHFGRKLQFLWIF